MGFWATSGLQVYCAKRISIGVDVLCGANVFIADNLHGVDPTAQPYRHQPLFKLEETRISDGAWLGQDVVVLPGSVVGTRSIIGANSVVCGCIPDFVIAAGAPARVIKRWDPQSRIWQRALK